MDGWILDVYPVSEGMCVWIIDTFGQACSYLDPWVPSFYLKKESFAPSPVDFLQKFLGSRGSSFSAHVVERREFFTNQAMSVLEVKLKNPLLVPSTVEALLHVPGLTLFNADLNLAQAYFYERDLFPLAFCSFDVTAENVIQAWDLRDSPLTLDYALPPLRYAYLGLAGASVDPNHKRGHQFLLTLGPSLNEGTTYHMDGSEEELLGSLNRHLADWDPDILLSDWGDSVLFPRLELSSHRTGIPLHLSRDSATSFSKGAARSFFTYGKMVYQAGPRSLRGRLHIDTKNSFAVQHSQLDGLFEIARLAKIPLQRAARCTIGTSLSSMQHNWAIQNGYLIPLDKGQTEDFRPADDLIASDRGGLVYEPELGWHEDLIEFDFESMYPEIMIRNNITPEAVNCSCCADNKVPEIHHHLCRRRIGMVPAVLAPIVKKRRLYKDMIKAGHPKKDIFKNRREAFKWALVTCFGYLGFRNARFGRIEAHECVNAYSREALLKAKEVAEGDGFHFVHGIVDSLWLKKSGASEEDVEKLRVKIEAATQLPLGYEGRYRWIHFCSSKTNPLVGVPNRYYGAFQNGAVKVRGLELRRHDTPLFIAELQTRLIDVMSQAKDLEALNHCRDQLQHLVEETRDHLFSRFFSPFQLAISVQLRREPSQYVHDTLSALAAKKLAAAGIPLHVGETIQYVVASERDKVKEWRVTPLAFIEDSFEMDGSYYERLLDRALKPFGPYL